MMLLIASFQGKLYGLRSKKNKLKESNEYRLSMDKNLELHKKKWKL